MAQQIINTGTAPNDGTGDTLKTSFTKTNANFTELYSKPPGNAYTASGTAPSSPNAGDFWYDLNSGILSIYVNDGNTSQWVQVSPSGGVGGGGSFLAPQGRLTLTATEPVMVTSVLNASNTYYTPYVGNLIPIYNGAAFVPVAFGTLTTTPGDTTQNPSAIGTAKVNDWFVWLRSGVAVLSHGPDWTNDTTRSAGTALVLVNGIWLNNATIGNGTTTGPAAQRGTYVGTTRSNDSNAAISWLFGGLAALGDIAALHVWNCYNRVSVATQIRDSTDGWNPPSGTIRATNGSTGMRVKFVCGLAEDAFSARFSAFATSGAGGGYVALGVGLDSTAAFNGQIGNFNSGGTVSSITTIAGEFTSAITVGAHFFQALEFASAAGCTVYGDAGFPATIQNGLTFTGRM